jgi:HEAT repeat protein
MNSMTSESQLQQRLRALTGELSPESKDGVTRAAQQLAAAGVTTLEQLEAQLNDPRTDPNLLGAACHLASRLKELKLAPALASVFRRSSDAQVVWEAAKALAALNEPQSLRAVLPSLAADEDEVRQAAAAWTMSVARHRPAIPGLLALLTNADLTPRVRGHAAEALGLLDAREAAASLIAALSDSSPEVRYWSVFALATLQASVAREAIERMAEEDDGETENGKRVADEAKWALTQIPHVSGFRLR